MNNVLGKMEDFEMWLCRGASQILQGKKTNNCCKKVRLKMTLLNEEVKVR